MLYVAVAGLPAWTLTSVYIEHRFSGLKFNPEGLTAIGFHTFSLLDVLASFLVSIGSYQRIKTRAVHSVSSSPCLHYAVRDVV